MIQRSEIFRLARDSTYNLLRFGWGLLIGMVISVLLARGLGRADRGIYALAVLLPDLMVTLLNLGIGPATVYFIGRGEYPPDQAIRKNIGLAFWVSAASITAGYILVSLVGERLYPGVPRPYLLFGLAVIPISLTTAYLISILHGLQDFKRFNLVGVFSQPLLLVLVIIFVWWLKKGVPGALVAMFLGNFGGLVLLISFLSRHIPLRRISDFRFDPVYTRKVLSYGLKAHLGNIVGFLNYRVDTFILNYLAGAGQVGLYSVAVGLGERLWIPSTAVATVILPRIASLGHDEDTRKRITPMTARFVFWFSLLVAIVVWALANWGIVLLYSTEYAASALALRILLPGIVMFNLTRILSNDIAGRGRPEINLIWSSAALVVNIAANILFIPRWGASGAAFSSTISYTFLAVLTTIVYCRNTGIPWRQVVLFQRSDLDRSRRAVLLFIANLHNRWKQHSPDQPQP